MCQTNCGNGIAEIGRKKNNLWDPNCGNAIVEIGRKKKICFGNCGNCIAENGKKKKKKKKGCYEICERVKKSCHVHNIFTTFSQ